MNKNFIKSLALSIALLFASSIPVFADINVSRISGYDRYETSINANKKYMNQANGNLAVIASGNDFKTALYGSYMASSLNVPYFVNPKHGVRTDILNEINRLNVNRVYVMGDYKILDKSIDNTLKSKGIKIERIYDKTIKEGSFTYVDPLYKVVDTILFNTFHSGEPRGDIGVTFLVNDTKFPDLLSSIPFLIQLNKQYAYALTSLSEVEKWVEDGFSDNDKKYMGFIIGGPNTIAEDYTTSGSDLNYPDSRIYGQNRYETAVEIAKGYRNYLNKDVKTAIIVNGDNYPDALSSSLVATQNNGAVLLTQSNKLNENTAKYIKDNNIKNVIIVGGEKSVSRNVENELKSLN